MRRDDLELRKVGGEIVERRQRPRPLQAPAESAGCAGTHARGADIYKDGNAELRDLLEQRPKLRIVDREIAADGMEVKADQAEVLDRMLSLLDRLRSLPGIHRGPRVEHDVRMPVTKAGHVVIGAGRTAGHRLSVERDHQHLDLGVAQLFDDLLFAQGSPRPVPVGAQRLDVRGDRVEPLHRIRMAMDVDAAPGC